ncbi:hypothetical protein V5279_18895 [Bradyrhizobium sp. 26S5]|uniref:hypothetical protein n=1 Tax=Bradyrhizobium sp. 26S5 TaxID=3139729 RepID=UPI0030CAFD13
MTVAAPLRVTSSVTSANTVSHNPSAEAVPGSPGSIITARQRSVRVERVAALSRAPRPARLVKHGTGTAVRQTQGIPGRVLPMLARQAAGLSVRATPIRPASQRNIRPDDVMMARSISNNAVPPAGLLAQRLRREEHAPKQSRHIVLAPSRPAPGRQWRGDAAVPVASAPARSRSAHEAALADLEKSLAAKLTRTIDKRVATTVEKSLSIDAGYSQAITEHVYATLYDKMVLERERLG